MKTRSVLSALFAFYLCLNPVHAQNIDMLVASGSGKGKTQAKALEAAKIEAVSVLVRTVMRRDTVYRDLFLNEALKNDWFLQENPARKDKDGWIVELEVRVDPGIAEALYFGRYSTTVSALLDQADEAIGTVEALLAEGSQKESNADLGGAETAYRLAEAKIAETLRYIGPVEDATFFSSNGNRKALEIKTLMASFRDSALEGLARIGESRDKLTMDQNYRNVLETMDAVEVELSTASSSADALHPLATSPKSYSAESLRVGLEKAKSTIVTLERRKKMLDQQAGTLSAAMEYPLARSELLTGRIVALLRELRSSASVVERELFARSPAVKALVWGFDHVPSDRLAMGMLFPIAMKPGQDGPETNSPEFQLDVSAEGAFSLGSGGFWGRTTASMGSDPLIGDASSSYLEQQVDAGFYGTGIFGLGLRWDWSRNVGNLSHDPVSALVVHLGSAGNDLGGRRAVPMWLLSASWEFPGEGEFILSRDLNLALETILRPSPSIRLEAGLASGARSLESGTLSYLAKADAGLGFRLPFLKPILWRVLWEGRYLAPVEGGEVKGNQSETDHAFRFGIEYTF